MNSVKLTTLCYLTRNDEVLFIVKGDTVKNRKNLNVGKYLGVGGHIEDNESAYECIVREIREETGITAGDIKGLKLRSVATFINDSCDNEVMYIYKGEYTGDTDPCPGSCDEGRLCWVKRKDLFDIPTWEGDREIFKYLFDDRYSDVFEIKLIYSKDELISADTYL